MMMNRRVGLICSMVILVSVFGGCSKEKKEPRLEEVTGTIERIDITTGKVVVRTFSQKHDKEITFDVMVNRDTEILINGSIATLRNLKIGETAFGSVRIVEGADDTKTITAVKVRVERAEVLKAPPVKAPPVKDTNGESEDAAPSDSGENAPEEGGE